MRFIPKRPTIEKIGLKKYLEDSKVLHGDLGYDDFVKRVELEEPKTVIARAFNVEKKTIYRWLEIYEKEQA